MFHPDDLTPFTSLLTDLYNLASSSDYIRDMRINEKLGSLLTLLINKFYLSKIFKETYGTTVNNYLISKRITRAKQLLRFTDMTVDEIGVAVGMGDANYFSRMFRKVEGISPREYRKQW